jgi:hypothetical protein
VGQADQLLQVKFPTIFTTGHKGVTRLWSPQAGKSYCAALWSNFLCLQAIVWPGDTLEIDDKNNLLASVCISYHFIPIWDLESRNRRDFLNPVLT